MSAKAVLAIDSLASVCVKQFQQLCTLLSEPEFRYTSEILPADIEDELGRFQLWAANIGALQPRNWTTSLEYRLRDSSRTRLQVMGFLEDIRGSLEDMISIVAGEPAQLSTETSTLPECDESDSSNSSIYDPLAEFRDLLTSVGYLITGLFKLSAVLKSPTPHDWYLMATSGGALDPQPDIDYVWHTVRQTNRSFSPSEWLIERLGKANARRRQYFLYREMYSNKSVHTPENLGTDEKDQAPEHMVADDERIHKSPFGYLSEGKWQNVLAPTTASAYQDKECEPTSEVSETLSSTSYAISIISGYSPGPCIPKAPKQSKNNTPFECPFCYTIQIVKSEQGWKKHVLRDLRPYVCTFKDCSMTLFTSRREWFQHELISHRKFWRCDKCHREFHSIQGFRVHIEECRPGIERLTKNELKTIEMKCEHPVIRISPSDCPLCDDWAGLLIEMNPDIKNPLVSPEIFEKHLGEHLEKLALFALPTLSSDDGEDEPNSNPVESVLSENSLGQKKNEADWIIALADHSQVTESGWKSTDEFLSLLAQCNSLSCEHKDVTELRSKIYCEAYHYHCAIYPKAVAFVRGIRFTIVQNYLQVKIEDFTETSAHVRKEWKREGPILLKLISEHKFVLANLNEISNAAELKEALWKANATKILDKAKTKTKAASPRNVGDVSAFLLGLIKNSKASEAQAKKYEEDAKLFNVAAVSVGVLLQCSLKLHVIIQCLMQTLLSIYIELDQVIHVTQMREQAPEYGIKFLQNFNMLTATATSRCDSFLKTQASYPQIMANLHANVKEAVTPELSEDWTKRFNEISESS